MNRDAVRMGLFAACGVVVVVAAAVNVVLEREVPTWFQTLVIGVVTGGGAGALALAQPGGGRE
jgi:hypothetical protein